MEVDPCGGKYWRFKYRFGGKEKRISLGVYPAVSLAAAREERDKYRKQLASGIDPGVARKAQKEARTSGTANSFEVVAREWLKVYIAPMAASHRKRVYARLENDVFPALGSRPSDLGRSWQPRAPSSVIGSLARLLETGAASLPVITAGSHFDINVKNG